MQFFGWILLAFGLGIIVGIAIMASARSASRYDDDLDRDFNREQHEHIDGGEEKRRSF